MPTAKEIADEFKQQLEEIRGEFPTLEQIYQRILEAPVNAQGIPLKLLFMQLVVIEDVRSTLKEILGHLARIEARRR